MNYTDSFTQMQKTKVDVRNASTVFSAKTFAALVTVTAIDANTGNPVQCDFVFTEGDPEFKAMLNDWGARKSTELLFPVNP